MSALLDLIGHYGVAFVFLCVLIEQAGAPLPAYPVLLAAGSMAAAGQQSFIALLAAAVVACLVSDSVWYGAGKRYGSRVLGTLCKLSLTPDGCVRQTEATFAKLGAKSLVVAKFVPGFSSVATAMAGSTGIARVPFMFYDGIGAALWAGMGLLLGWLFAPAVEDVLIVLGQMGRWGALLLVIFLAAFIGAKLWRRYQFRSQLRMERVTVEDLALMRQSGEAPIVVDVRSTLSQGEHKIAGAVSLVDGVWPGGMSTPEPNAVVVVYCACPNEASAALLAKRLMRDGYTRVFPLAGGIDAWRAAGFELEAISPGAVSSEAPASSEPMLKQISIGP